MSLIGDLERLFATSLYPLRVPIAIALAVALIGLAVIARRRGWFAAARRHPLRSGTVLGVLLVVVLPIGWYLASPLFVRISLVEPPPTASQTAAPPAPGARSERRGEFQGADDFHFGSGTARLLETAPGTFTVRFEGFSVRNGPDLYVYLSPRADGYADGAIELGKLKATDGDFNTDVPNGTDVSAARSVIIWCKQFAVLFAVAELR